MPRAGGAAEDDVGRAAPCACIGHPARAVGLQRLLDYMLQQQDVWITRRLDIARHWLATHPYPGKGLNE